MRTRNADAPKPAAPKRTLRARKSAAKAGPGPSSDPNDAAAGSATPQVGETKRVSATRARQARKTASTPARNENEDPTAEPSRAEEVEASANAAAEVKPVTKVRTTPKSTGRKTAGRTKSPASTKALSSQMPKSLESVEVPVEETFEEMVVLADAHGEDDNSKIECAPKCVEEPLGGEKTDLAMVEPPEDVIKPVDKEQALVQVEKAAIEDGGHLVDNVKSPLANFTVFHEREQMQVEVEIAPPPGGEESLKEEINAEATSKPSDDREVCEVKQGEEVIEKRDLLIGTNAGSVEKSQNMKENVQEKFQGDCLQTIDDDYRDDDEGMEEYGDRLDFGEPGEEDIGEDDGDEPAEEADTLEEEHKELSAIAKEQKIKKEHEIFVGGLDRDAVEEDVRRVFERIGEIVEIRLHKEFSTNKNKGYAFVKFANKEHAKRALVEMKNPVIRGKRCGTAPSEDNDILFLGNICNTWTKEAIKQKLKEYGVEGVESITLVPDALREGLSRGFAFLEFSCHSDAMLAYKRLQKPDVVFGHSERTAKVAFGEPLRDHDPEVMAQVKSVFIDGLPPYWDEECVREQLKTFGEIVRVVLARNMSTAKRKDFGFVDFSSHEAAVACVDGINTSELGNGNTKAKVRARLSNPMPKTQAVKGGMSGGFRIGRGSVSTVPRHGRGFGWGGHSYNRGNYHSWNFHQRGHDQSSRMHFSYDHEFDNPYSDFHRRQSSGGGGRRGISRGGHYMSGRHVPVGTSSRPPIDRPWRGYPDRGPGMHLPSRRLPYSPEEQYNAHFEGRQFDDHHFYDSGAHGLKRPFPMTDQNADYMEPSRVRPRFDFTDSSLPLHGSVYRDAFGVGSGPYPHDYYGSDQYGRGPYPSYYGDDRSYGGGYYY
ncbi:nucleolin-like isoform X1 [Rhodamnia argentea]|uniref:Nucleolin-like isoform X1 n=1 Tax=Rhodamnia argentea TaxID=178133 RepID=A0ABM3GUY3_9MYRT|nr:nucleolin-like isoform X1 [Rhodamnia argentea]